MRMRTAGINDSDKMSDENNAIHGLVKPGAEGCAQREILNAPHFPQVCKMSLLTSSSPCDVKSERRPNTVETIVKEQGSKSPPPPPPPRVSSLTSPKREVAIAATLNVENPTTLTNPEDSLSNISVHSKDMETVVLCAKEGNASRATIGQSKSMTSCNTSVENCEQDEAKSEKSSKITFNPAYSNPNSRNSKCGSDKLQIEKMSHGATVRDMQKLMEREMPKVKDTERSNIIDSGEVTVLTEPQGFELTKGSMNPNVNDIKTSEIIKSCYIQNDSEKSMSKVKQCERLDDCGDVDDKQSIQNVNTGDKHSAKQMVTVNHAVAIDYTSQSRNSVRTEVSVTERSASEKSKTKSSENSKSRGRSDRSRSDRSSRSSTQEAEVRVLARSVAGSMETLIDNLHHVVGDIQQLVLQIDIVTDSLDRRHCRQRSGCSSTMSLQGSVSEYSLSTRDENFLQGSCVEDSSFHVTNPGFQARNSSPVQARNPSPVSKRSSRHTKDYALCTTNPALVAEDTALVDADPSLETARIKSMVDQVSAYLDHSRARARSKASHRFSYPQYRPGDSEVSKGDFTSCRRSHKRKERHQEKATKEPHHLNGRNVGKYWSGEEDKDWIKTKTCLDTRSGFQAGPSAKYHSRTETQFDSKQAWEVASKHEKRTAMDCVNGDDARLQSSKDADGVDRPGCDPLTRGDTPGHNDLPGVDRHSPDNLPGVDKPSQDNLPDVDKLSKDNPPEVDKPSHEPLPELKNWREMAEQRRCGSAESLTPQMDWSYLSLSEHEPIPILRLEGIKVPFTDFGALRNANSQEVTSDNVSSVSVRPANCDFTSTDLKTHMPDFQLSLNPSVSCSSSSKLCSPSSNLSQRIPPMPAKRDRSKLVLTGLKIKHQMGAITENNEVASSDRTEEQSRGKRTTVTRSCEVTGSSVHKAASSACSSHTTVTNSCELLGSSVQTVASASKSYKQNAVDVDVDSTDVFLQDRRSSARSSLGLSDASSADFYDDENYYSDDVTALDDVTDHYSSNSLNRPPEPAADIHSIVHSDEVSSLTTCSSENSTGTVVYHHNITDCNTTERQRQSLHLGASSLRNFNEPSDSNTQNTNTSDEKATRSVGSSHARAEKTTTGATRVEVSNTQMNNNIEGKGNSNESLIMDAMHPTISSNIGAVPKVTQGIGGALLGWAVSSKALPAWSDSAGDLSSIGASDSDIDDLSSPFLPQHFHPRTSSAADPSPDWNTSHIFPGYVHHHHHKNYAKDSGGTTQHSLTPQIPHRGHRPRNSAADSSPGCYSRHFFFPPRKLPSVDASPVGNPVHTTPSNLPLTGSAVNCVSAVADTQASQTSVRFSYNPKYEQLSSSGSSKTESQSDDGADVDRNNKDDSVFLPSTVSQSSLSDAGESGGFDVRTRMETSPESDVTNSYHGQYENAMETRLEGLVNDADVSDFSDADADVGSDALEQSLTSLESSGVKYDRDLSTWKSYTMTHIDSDDVVSDSASDVFNENVTDRVTTNPGFDDVNLNFDDVSFPSVAF